MQIGTPWRPDADAEAQDNNRQDGGRSNQLLQRPRH